MSCVIKVIKKPESQTEIAYVTLTYEIENDIHVETLKVEENPWKQLYQAVSQKLNRTKHQLPKADLIVYTALAGALCTVLPMWRIPPNLLLALRSTPKELNFLEPMPPEIYQHLCGIEMVDDLKVQMALKECGLSTVYGVDKTGFIVNYYNRGRTEIRHPEYNKVIRESEQWIEVPEAILARLHSSGRDISPIIPTAPIVDETEFKMRRLERINGF